MQVCQPLKEKKKLRKLRKDALKDEGKKLFTEVSAFDNVYIEHATQSKIGGLGTGMNLLSELHSFSTIVLSVCLILLCVFTMYLCTCLHVCIASTSCGKRVHVVIDYRRVTWWMEPRELHCWSETPIGARRRALVMSILCTLGEMGN